jgi:hypothetical protein
MWDHAPHRPIAMHLRTCSALSCLLGGALLAQAPAGPTTPVHTNHGALIRCGTPAVAPTGAGIDNPDCDYNQTNPSGTYAPTTLLRIPVVVHVIQTTSGTGFLSDTLVQSQITVLNEDFRALAGTPGAGGTDSQIEFFLATVDPNGAPTNGIVRHTNNTWFADAGNYWATTAWNTARYLNIYTNQAGGALGYVPSLPQSGSVLGTTADRVVIEYGAFGRPGIGGVPYDRGRTATHEVGHYLGLFHTFDSGCGSASACYTTGDRICDTASEANARFGCPGSATSCGTPDPIHNYMDYTDDTCMTGFSPEQVRRMRCTLVSYRPLLAQPAGPVASAVSRFGAGNLNTALSASAPRLGTNTSTTVLTFNTGFQVAGVYGFLSSASLPFQGYTILVDTTSPQIMNLPLQVNALVCSWTWAVPNDASLAGLPLKTQGLLLGSSFALTNAMDLVIGN